MNLKGTSVTDDHIRLLHGAPLRVLSLWGTLVTDRCLLDLRRIRSLSDIFVYDTAITEEGVRSLESWNVTVFHDYERKRMSPPNGAPRFSRS